MTAADKRLTLETWMTARCDLRVRVRKSIRIAQASGLPASEIRTAIMELLDELEKQETDR